MNASINNFFKVSGRQSTVDKFCTRYNLLAISGKFFGLSKIFLSHMEKIRKLSLI